MNKYANKTTGLGNLADAPATVPIGGCGKVKLAPKYQAIGPTTHHRVYNLPANKNPSHRQHVYMLYRKMLAGKLRPESIAAIKSNHAELFAEFAKGGQP